MIKLERPPKPKELAERECDLLTEYKNSKKDVWRKDYIKEPLLRMSHNKCAYCETGLKVYDSYMEIEHFHPKSLYEEKVIEWGNWRTLREKLLCKK